MPLAEARRTPPQVDRHIEDLATNHAHQFSLRMANLVMQPAQNISRGKRLIVLHESFTDPEISHDFFVIALQKKTSRIPKNLRFKKEQSRKRSGSGFHKSKSINKKTVILREAAASFASPTPPLRMADYL